MRSSARNFTGAITAAAAAICSSASIAMAAGDGDRTISFYHIHTKETLTILYKKDGEFIPDALKKIDWIMRDWRKNEAIKIDPATVDIIWEMHEELGSKEPVHIICGYRSRGTNEMLRRTVGGQASQSQHITGKAIDIAFPDIPARQLRYSAMIRERGGVGYYPTSGIPFVHVDTGRVRHWPRMVRDELALLFPSGRSQHEPADGRPISPADVKAARQRSKEINTQVAQYFALRDRPRTPVLVADAGSVAPILPPEPQPAARPAPPPAPEQRMGVGAPTPSADEMQRAAAPVTVAAVEPPATDWATSVETPTLTGAPRPVDRPSKFSTAASDADRSRLDMLVKLASVEASDGASAQPASLVAAQPKAAQAKPIFATASLGPLLPAMPAHEAGVADGRLEVASLGSASTAAPPELVTAQQPAAETIAFAGPGARSSWLQAPAYDEEHPEELSYRPFPLAPLLTASASHDDPLLTRLVPPDAARTFDALDEDGSDPATRVRTELAEHLWTKEFRGEALNLDDLYSPRGETRAPAGRPVRTVSR